MRPIALLLSASLWLAGCGVTPAPLADQLSAGQPQAEWLTPKERSAAEQQIQRLLEAKTPDGRVEVDTIEVQQRLFSHRYPFKASKRVIRPWRTFVYRVEGVYSDVTDTLRVDHEVEVVRPND